MSTELNLKDESQEKVIQQPADLPVFKSEPQLTESQTSPSRRSRLDSKPSLKPSEPVKYRRWRTLKRKFKVRPVVDGDLKYFHASSVLSGGEKIPHDEFVDQFVSATMGVQHMSTIVDRTDKPVGLVYQNGNGMSFDTRVDWMQWASPRDIITAALSFINKHRFKQTIMITSTRKDDRFCEQLARYGVMRRVGYINKFFADGADAVLWQSRGK